MALIKCPLCGKRVNSSFAVCPHCGSPVESGPAAESIKRAKDIKETKPHKPLTAAIFTPFIIVYLVIFLFAAAMITLTVISFVNHFTEKGNKPDDDVSDPNPSVSVIINADDMHSHYYESEITQQATCTESGVRSFTCDCGHSYTQSIATTPHSYSAATCSSPKKCMVCGATSGSPLTHNYMNGKCLLCGGADPKATTAINSSSLSLPALPKTFKDTLGGSVIATVTVTDISYKFTYEAENTVSLSVTLSGSIASGIFGAPSIAQVGYTLYGPDGNQVKKGTLLLNSMGEDSFSSTNTLLYVFDSAKTGNYRLELTDTK